MALLVPIFPVLELFLFYFRSVCWNLTPEPHVTKATSKGSLLGEWRIELCLDTEHKLFKMDTQHQYSSQNCVNGLLFRYWNITEHETFKLQKQMDSYLFVGALLDMKLLIQKYYVSGLHLNTGTFVVTTMD